MRDEFRRAEGTGWIRASQRLEPRSIYILEDEVRTAWEHSVPPVDALRYSLTFRTVAEGLRVDTEKLSLEKVG
jgi:alkylated DNA repair dioxygenase AlkB